MDEPVKPFTAAGKSRSLLGLVSRNRRQALRCSLHVFRSALANAFRVAVAPYLRRENLSVSLVDVIADRLPDEMI